MSTTKFQLWAVPTSVTSYETGSAGTHSVVSASGGQFRWSDVVVMGDNIPGWKVLIARHQSATTSLDGTRLKLGKVAGQSLTVYPKSVYSCRQADFFGNFFQSISPIAWLPSISSAIDPAADDKARSKLLEHYISSTRKFFGSGFIAEFRENVEMFKKPLHAFRSGFGNIAKNMAAVVRRGSRRHGNLRRDLGNMWLEWSFAIKPTISDLNDLSEAVNGSWSETSSIPLRGFGRSTSVTVEPRCFVNLPSWYALPGVYCERQTKVDSTVRYKGSTVCSGVPTSSLQRFGLSLLDLPGGIWEGTPWSWTVDYFLNVQEILDSMRLAFVDVAWLNRTVRNAKTINAYNYRCEDGSIARGPNHSYVLGTAVSRRRIDAIPFPRLHLQIPGLTSTKWLNVASVVQQFDWIENRLRKLHL